MIENRGVKKYVAAAQAAILIGQGQLYREVGLIRLLPTGTDMTLTLPLNEEGMFLAGERPIFALRYK
ncbi:MAG: hypothetical protein PHO37_07680 [Kiritimatiellae bacterium]|nr:hypothetical protein [Kiritimatiellia bacterium]